MEPEKRLRRNSTDAEKKLWSHLRSAQLGHKFRRQHELLGYIVDFVCAEKHLIVELDGGQHASQEDYDQKRTAALHALGFRVLRFWNDDVLRDTEGVLAAINTALTPALPPHPNPLPRQRRGRGSRGVVANHDNQRNGTATRLRINLEQRARLYALIRDFFAARRVLEVETPVMSAGANTDPNIQSFSTEFSGHVDSGVRRRWLRTSSEFAQKRLLAAGVGDNYELGRVLRNGEAGRRHNPEFTMLEWYRVAWDHRRLIDETVELIQAALRLVERTAHVQATSYRNLFLDACNVDPFVASEQELQAALRDVRIDAQGLSRDDWLDLILTHRIQPDFPHDRLTVVYDYPATQCALAKIRSGTPPVAERFEIYLGVHELANGYHELTDAAGQRARFEHDNARRRTRGEAELPLDENLLGALARGMPDCAGVALGIERLLMAMTGSEDIRDVLAFAFSDA